MRVLLFCVALLAASGCTKRNENLCCIDEADCNQIGESAVVPCNDGLVCRGNLCIAIACASNTDCDATAPFCDTATGRCEEACEMDNQCPGVGGDPALSVCEAGSCLECRDDGECGGVRPSCVSNVCVECSDDSQCGGAVAACVNNECIECRDDAQCPASTPACVSNQCVECSGGAQCEGMTPVCEENSCRACTANYECASNLCVESGECIREDQISHVSPNGPATAACTLADPCSLTRGLELVTSQPFVILADGVYESLGALVLNYQAHIIGNPDDLPVIRNTAQHDDGVFRTGDGATDATLENVELVDASGGLTPFSGSAVLCIAGRLTLRNVRVSTSNRAAYVRNCELNVFDSEIVNNLLGEGIFAPDGVVNVERSFLHGLSRALNLGSTAAVRNTVISQNTTGVLGKLGPGTQFEFNTIVDNSVGITCPGSTFTSVAIENSIIAANYNGNFDGQVDNCVVATSRVSDTLTEFRFVRPTEPYDYHITAGSQAIDQAVGGDTVVLDIDREPRPAGAARDLGADELQ